MTISKIANLVSVLSPADTQRVADFAKADKRATQTKTAALDALHASGYLYTDFLGQSTKDCTGSDALHSDMKVIYLTQVCTATEQKLMAYTRAEANGLSDTQKATRKKLQQGYGRFMNNISAGLKSRQVDKSQNRTTDPRTDLAKWCTKWQEKIGAFDPESSPLAGKEVEINKLLKQIEVLLK